MASLPLSADANDLNDFNSDSPYDGFSADAELIFRHWQLKGEKFPPQLTTTTPRIPSPAPGWNSPIIATSISLKERFFSIQLHFDNDSERTTCSLDSAPLQRLVGTNCAILLASPKNDEIVAWDENDAFALLSALTIAMMSVNITIPLFVPVGRASRFRLIGRRIGIEPARYSCHVQAYIPESLLHIGGLLSLFASKRTVVKRGRRKPRPTDAYISAKFSYRWADFSLQVPNTPRNDLSPGERLANAIEASLGEFDPVKAFRIVALWDKFEAVKLREGSMRAAAANRIRITIELNQKQPPPGVTPLATAARACLRLALRSGAEILPFGAPAAQQPLVECVVRRSVRSSQQEQFATLKARFFADARHILATASVEQKSLDIVYITAALGALLDPGAEVDLSISSVLGPLADTQTTLERLARLIGTLHDVRSAQLLWSLFVDGVEMYWNARIPIPGLGERCESGCKRPNLYETLLAQKLQMINCCIQREDQNERARENADQSGRKKIIEGIQLVNGGGEVWEPNVQESSLVTRDIVEAEQDRLVAGGGSGEDVTRTLCSDMAAFKKANPGAVMSDFVRWFSPSDWVENESETDAASPSTDGWIDIGSVTDEGAAWDLSPEAKSQVEEEVLEVANVGQQQQYENGGNVKSMRRKGRMSVRMRKPGNEWEVLWNEAGALAAHEQKALFEPSQHGANALRNVREMTLSAVLIHLGCAIGMGGARILVDSMELPRVKRGGEEARALFRSLSAAVPMSYTEAEALRGDAAQLNEAVTMLDRAELAALKAMSLCAKMPDTTDELKDALDMLAVGRDGVLKGRLERGLVARIANLDDEADWTEAAIAPDNREFHIVGDDGKDRMYARLSEVEFRTAFRLCVDFSPYEGLSPPPL